MNKDEICRLIKAAPGLEHHHQDEPATTDATSLDALKQIRSDDIKNALADNLLPRDTCTRVHGKSEINGIISFVEMGALMRECWKNCDDEAKSVFGELADEGRKVYRQRLDAYTIATKQASAKGSKSTKNCNASPKYDTSSDESVLHAMATVYVPKTCNGSSASATTQRSSFLAYHRDESSSITNVEMELAADNLRRISADSSSLQDSFDETTDVQYARVKELEDQLATEKLRLCVKELENELSKQRATEGQLRMHLDMLSQSGANATANNNTGLLGTTGQLPTDTSSAAFSRMSFSRPESLPRFSITENSFHMSPSRMSFSSVQPI